MKRKAEYNRRILPYQADIPKEQPNYAMIAVMALLLVILVLAGVEPVELMGFKSSLSNGTSLSIGGSKHSVGGSSSTGAVLKNDLQNLPMMLEGC